MNLYKVKQTEDCDYFILDSFKNNDDLFDQVQLQSHYDCYSFKIADAKMYSGVIIKINPRIELFTVGGLVMMCELKMEYTILDNTEPLRDIIFKLLEDSHKDFIRFFNERTISSKSNKYKPEFKSKGLWEYLENQLA